MIIRRLKENHILFSWLLLLALAIIWGSSFILIKKGLLAFSAAEVGALRILFAALFSLPIALSFLGRLRKRHLWLLLLIGFLGSFIPAFLFAFAETAISSSLTGILNALTPLFVLILGAAFFRQRITLKSSIGLAIGFAGTLLLILAGNGRIGSVNYYALLVVLATICYGVNTNIIKNFLSEVHPVAITTVSLLFVGPLSLVYLLIFSDFTAKVAAPGIGWPLTAIIILGVLGTGVALILFNKLVQMRSAVFASLVTYLIPLIAVFWGLIDGEILGYQHFIGMGAILGGVYVANRL